MSEFSPLVRQITECLLEKKAEDIQVLHLAELSSVADTFILCTATSNVQSKAIADHVMETVKRSLGERTFGREGMEANNWVVLDYFDVVVHIFLPEARAYYGLERMWRDAPVTTVQDP
jgi:ribosome-associated protein